MQYILLDIGYQEICGGVVVRYADLDGNTIEPPTGYGGTVIDGNPPPPTWALPDPTPVVEPAASRLVTVFSFRNRFTPEEKHNIYLAAEANIDIKIWLDDLDSLQDDEIDLTAPMTVGSVTALEQAGLIGAGRAGEILNA